MLNLRCVNTKNFAEQHVSATLALLLTGMWWMWNLFICICLKSEQETFSMKICFWWSFHMLAWSEQITNLSASRAIVLFVCITNHHHLSSHNEMQFSVKHFAFCCDGVFAFSEKWGRKCLQLKKLAEMIIYGILCLFRAAWSMFKAVHETHHKRAVKGVSRSA